MNRRNFLKGLIATTAGLYVPNTLYFDVGKNLKTYSLNYHLDLFNHVFDNLSDLQRNKLLKDFFRTSCYADTKKIILSSDPIYANYIINTESGKTDIRLSVDYYC